MENSRVASVAEPLTVGGAIALGVDGTNLFAWQGQVFFQGPTEQIYEADAGLSSGGLWVTDGTPAGTVPLTPVVPQQFTPYGGALFFDGFTPDLGFEVWRTDGTPAGTYPLVDLCPGPCSANPTSFVELDGGLYFFAQDGTGWGLWSSDGTDAGTSLVRRLQPEAYLFGGDFAATMMPIRSANGLLFFVADDGDAGPWGPSELWRSDGTAQGTFALSPPDPDRTTLIGAALPGGNLLFGPGSSFGNQLWVTDGTDGGTYLIATLDNFFGFDTHGSVGSYGSMGSSLYSCTQTTLWRSDGTTWGTVPVAEFSGGSCHDRFAEMGGFVYFAANDGFHGLELWRTDGTDGGTQLVQDIYAGPDSGLIESFPNYYFGPYIPPLSLEPEGVLFFTANDGVHGFEPWRSDGTAAGTRQVADLVPGQGSSEPYVSNALFFATLPGGSGIAGQYSFSRPVRIGGQVLFSAAVDADGGRQLWAMDVVDIADSLPPVVTCPGGVTTVASADGGAVVYYSDATATDDITFNPAISYSTPSGSWFPVGVTQVLVSATDNGGNVGSCSFDVTVIAAQVLDAGQDAETADGGLDAGAQGPIEVVYGSGGTAPIRAGCACSGAAPGDLFVPALALLGAAVRRRVARAGPRNARSSRECPR